MPSACTKPENKASSEATDPIKQVLNVIDKKVRNLEKRKGKLDAYRESFEKGKELNEDQREAVGRYDVVVHNLEFARELQKHFLSIQAEAEKLLKKQVKREAHERQQLEIRRFKELLAVQNLLDSMGSDEVRSDFKDGKQGAVQLSEENLNQLDELYKLISPSRDGETKYEDQLTVSADHIVNFLDAKEKEVAGTTYKDLKTLVDKISECGYFEKKGEVEEEAEEQAEAPEATPVEEPISVAQEEEQPAIQEEELDFTASTEIQAPSQPLETPAELPQPIMEQQTVASLDFGLGVSSSTKWIQLRKSDPQMLGSQTQQPFPDQSGVPTNEEDTFFSTSTFSTRPRPFNEIVSSVQGSFNFLQDSELEQQNAAKAQAAAKQRDPAVVAAQMVAAPQQSADTGLSFLDTDPAAAQFSKPSTTQESSSDSLSQSAAGSTQFGVADTQATSHQSIDSQQFTDQTVYAQSLMTQSLQNTAQQYEASQQGFSASADQSTFAQMTASGAAGSTEMGENGPQPIPMPGQYDGAAGQDSKNKKQFSMNPNADIFQSMYTQASSGTSDSGYQQTTAPSDKGYSADQNAWSSSGGYESGSQGYNQYNNGNRRGGSQNYRGNRGMSNGYRGDRGRGGTNTRGRGGQFNGRGRGGDMQGSRGGGRGGTRGGGNRGSNRGSNYGTERAERGQRMGSQ